jgi:tRNA pseudouridine55 synthase
MNGIIIADKPEGWTSHDVVSKLRRVLGEKRIGHGGTLDPMATGVLPLFVGRATRAVEFAESADKEYVAGLKLGIVTDTQDVTGTVLSEQSADIGEEKIRAALSGFLGESLQLPPLFSAVKVKGKRLYEYARRGADVERSTRPIVIFELEPLGWHGGEYRFRVVCSKGVYIRTLCHDLGQRLGCGAAMSYLRRTRAGVFGIDRAARLEEIIAAADAGELGNLLLPVAALFEACPRLEIGTAEESRLRNGASVSLGGIEDGRYRVYGQSGEFLALVEADKGALKIIKSFHAI